MGNYICLSIKEEKKDNLRFLIDDLKNIDDEYITAIIEKKEDNINSLNVIWITIAIGLTINISSDIIKYLVLQIKNSLRRNKKNEIKIKIQGIEINIKSDSKEDISIELIQDILNSVSRKNEWK